MHIRKATRADCRALAELALMAGEGIPAFFWAQAQRPGQDIIDVGSETVASEEANFSYLNAHVAELDGTIAGMMLAYRLPAGEAAEALDELPEFIRPLVELEQCMPDSFYINMIAAYPGYRGRGVGTGLLGGVDRLARAAGCSLASIEVFEQNQGALRLYERLGYRVVERRAVVPHPCHPYAGDIVLLTRAVV
ncbi:MAG: GNAT family N-acetyltransferase [Gammaproteobacteria bacterium]|nr:GNAT family N-acetyltransferase [Gammaproteobacteria bacterium]